MMKKLLITLMVFLFAASAYAGGLDVKGKFRVEGNYDNNIYTPNAIGYGFADEDQVVNRWYEQSFDLWTTFTANENTSVTALWNLLGEEEYGHMWDYGPAEDSVNGDDVHIDRLFLTHKFGNGFVFEGGLITWGDFGTTFGDDQEGWYGLSLSKEFSFGTLTIHTIKMVEAGGYYWDVEDAEKEDSNIYAVTYANTFGDINLQARGQYQIDSFAVNNDPDDYPDSDSEDTIALDVAVNGTAGSIGFEAEAIVANITTDDEAYDDDKVTLFALYGDVWMNINDQVKAGGWLAYTSVDEYYADDNEESMDFGEDFNRSLIYLDEYMSYSGLDGTTAMGLYADFSINDDMTVSPSLLYWMSNWDGDDSTGYELDIIFAWKLSDAVTYTARAGYADISLDWDGGGEPDTGAAIKASHEIAVEF